MSKFKVGDKVRVVNAIVYSNYNGREARIVDVNDKRGAYDLQFVGANGCDQYWWYDRELELVEPALFTKDNLKDGMVVEYRNGRRRLVLNEKFIGEDGRTHFTYYNDDLTANRVIIPAAKHRDFDIMKIYTTAADYIIELFNDSALTLIWERKEEPAHKEMTVEEIEKELGYKIKVVGDNSCQK